MTLLPFHKEYEAFYKMSAVSRTFQTFCKEAFGEDFSQDGFSDIDQINRILQYIPEGEKVHILDVGCGNGKMLGYLQNKTNAFIHGFDYSEQGIKLAKELHPDHSEFEVGMIGEIEYPSDFFDVIISMDTMYFAKDMTAFVSQIKKWLKKNGVFFVGYQEGDIMPKTENAETTELAEALRANGMSYEVMNITRQTYDLLKKKRETAISHQAEFAAEDGMKWFDMLMLQTECCTEPYEVFRNKMVRYLFVIRK